MAKYTVLKMVTGDDIAVPRDLIQVQSQLANGRVTSFETLHGIDVLVNPMHVVSAHEMET